VIEYSITFELVTGKQVTLDLKLPATGDLYEVLNSQWVGTTEERVNMNHVTHYFVN